MDNSPAQWEFSLLLRVRRACEMADDVTSGVLVKTQRRYGLRIPYLPNVTHSDADQRLDRNPFVETSIRYALSYIAALLASPILSPSTVTILADNDYYTTPATLKPAERQHTFGVPLSKAHKTGLGSSAALVTALTAALLTHYLPNAQFDLSSATGKRRLHNLAQAAHCAAQGKVGSGFDVASAVFGSCLYRRFSPAVLSTLPDPGARGFATKLREAVEETDAQWDTAVLKDEVKVPPGLRLVMCDVSCGSQTPGMVRKVLAWRTANPDEAGPIWRDLHTANLSLAAEMRRVTETCSTDYSALGACFEAMRKQIRLMGDKSGVPIEPPAQTRLIDACRAIPGVVGGTVPGAGGYDAVVLMIESRESVISELNRLFRDWRFDGEADGGGRVSMLGVREEMEGARTETVAAYGEWFVRK